MKMKLTFEYTAMVFLFSNLRSLFSLMGTGKFNATGNPGWARAPFRCVVVCGGWGGEGEGEGVMIRNTPTYFMLWKSSTTLINLKA